MRDACRDILYVIYVMLCWPFIAAFVALIITGVIKGIFPVGDAQVFIPSWFIVLIAGWLYTMPRH